MPEPTIPQRFKIALSVILGKTSGRIGKKTTCDQFLMENGNKALHQSEWDLQVSSPYSTCKGSIRIKENQEE